MLECSTLFLVTSTTDIHWNLLAIGIWVTERNCSSIYIHNNILIFWILSNITSFEHNTVISNFPVTKSVKSLTKCNIVLWSSVKARVLSSAYQNLTRVKYDESDEDDRKLTCIFLKHWSVYCLTNAEQKRFQILLLQCIVYTCKNRIYK